MKKIIRKLHLWLGFASGLVVFVMAVTGCIYAFQYEITEATQPWRNTATSRAPYLQPTALKRIADRYLPGKHAHSIIYGKPGRAAQVVYFGENERGGYYDIVYINPSTGDVQKVADMNRDFFRIILMGHYYLWLPPQIGQPIAASATLVFVVMMITGIILWWPKSKSAAKQRFRIKWSAKWKRRNYDLHNVLGFYMTWIGIFIALTGLVWGFEWFAGGVYSIASGGTKKYVPFYEAVSDTTQQTTTDTAAADRAWMLFQPHLHTAQTVEVHYPENAASAVGVTINPETDLYWKTDYHFLDQYTLKEIPVSHHYTRFDETISGADKMLRMNYDLHTGGIWGFPGKCLAFFASLICASLPVTGFMIWLGRRKKVRAEVRAQQKVSVVVNV